MSSEHTFGRHHARADQRGKSCCLYPLVPFLKWAIIALPQKPSLMATYPTAPSTCRAKESLLQMQKSQWESSGEPTAATHPPATRLLFPPPQVPSAQTWSTIGPREGLLSSVKCHLLKVSLASRKHSHCLITLHWSSVLKLLRTPRSSC